MSEVSGKVRARWQGWTADGLTQQFFRRVDC